MRQPGREPSVQVFRVAWSRPTGRTWYAPFTRDGADGPVTRLSQMTPVEDLTAPGLWVGLLFAAGFVAVAVQLRRRREGL